MFPRRRPRVGHPADRPESVILISDDPAGRGGIAAVARGIVADLSPIPVTVRPSYRLGATPVGQLKLFATSAAYLVANVRRRRSSVVHVHLAQRGSFLREGSLVALAGALGFRVVVTLHGSESRQFLLSHPRLGRAVLRRPERVYCLGPNRARDVLEITGVDAGVLTNFVPVPAPGAATDRRPRQVVFVGELSYRKGVDTLADAWAEVHRRVPSAQLVVVGTDRGEQHRLESLPACTLLGQLTASQTQALIRSSALLVLPSRAEGQPMVVLEAMAAGVPVVATDVGEVAWTVGDGGVVIPPDDAPALVDAVTRLVADDDELARRGRQGAHIVAARFSIEAGRARYAAVYGTRDAPITGVQAC